MRTKVKICGIRSLEAAIAAANAGADFLGFNFVPTSPRFIEPTAAKEIITHFSSYEKIVGVFQNEKIEKIIEIIEELRLDFVQLHDELLDYQGLTQYAGVIKVFHVVNTFDCERLIKTIRNYDIDYVLLDRERQGSGDQLNLQMVRKIASVYKTFLAGGLTPENVSAAVKIAQPYAVDVAAGVEINGNKDPNKMKMFVQKAKQ